MEDLKQVDRRHYFARIRTQLANERTLMSYYRSGFALIGLGAFVFKFYQHMIFYVLSGVFVLAGLSLGIYGYLRYNRFKEKLLRK